MRLLQLVADLDEANLERLAKQHIPERTTLDALSRGDLESVLRSFRFVQDTVLGRQPPAFALLLAVLESPGYEIEASSLRIQASMVTDEICGQIDAEEILSRDDGLRLYRRILYEARRVDLIVDASEAALLGIMRRELGISLVEHYLLEFHADFREFWQTINSYDREIDALAGAGLLFRRQDAFVIAEDVAPMVWQSLGIDLPRSATYRFFESLSGQRLSAALRLAGAQTSGSKDDKIRRLLANRIQPSAVLRELNLGSLRELCRWLGIGAYGAKADLADRIMAAFLEGRPTVPTEVQIAPASEPRDLSESSFRRLFGSLSGSELGKILSVFPELRQSGPKQVRVETLWKSWRSERTLLAVLRNRDLDGSLQRLGQRAGGSKLDRVWRLIAYFRDNEAVG